MSLPSEAYWARRAEAVLLSAERTGDAYNRELEKAYDRAIGSIEQRIAAFYARYASKEGITAEEARKILGPAELKSYREETERYYAEAETLAPDPAYQSYLRTMSGRSYISREQSLLTDIRREIEILAHQEDAGLGDTLKGVYGDGYSRTLFNTFKGLGAGVLTPMPSTTEIERLVRTPWLGQNYSGRVWAGKEKLLQQLNVLIPQSFSAGRSVKGLSDELARKMGVAYSSAERLVRTEVAHTCNQAALDSYTAAGIAQYQFLATLDPKTSVVCRELDGKVFDVADEATGINAPPMHPNCRSTTIPYFEDDESIGKRAARDGDGKTYFVPDDLTYGQWREKYVDKPENSGIINTKPFISARSVKEAQEWALEQGLADAVSYKGVDLETANEWNRAFHETLNRYPELRENSQFLGEAHERNAYYKPILREQLLEHYKKANPYIGNDVLEPYVEAMLKKRMRALSVSRNTYAMSCNIEPIKGITVNREYGKDAAAFRAALKRDVEAKFHPAGCDTIRSVADHELGHQIDTLLNISDRERVRDMFKSYKGRTDELTEQLSRYAWRNSNPKPIREFVAEAYAEYRNNPNPRSIAKEIGEIIEKEYAQWKGRK